MFSLVIRPDGETVITAYDAQHSLHAKIVYTVDSDTHIIKATETVTRRATAPEGTMFFASTGEDMNALYQLFGLVQQAKLGQGLIGLVANAAQQTLTPKYRQIQDDGRVVAANTYSNEPANVRAPFQTKQLHTSRLIIAS